MKKSFMKKDRITAFLFSEKTKQENEFKLQKMTKVSNAMRAIIINHALLFDFENQIIMTVTSRVLILQIPRNHS